MEIRGDCGAQDAPVLQATSRLMYDGVIEQTQVEVQAERLLKVYVNGVLTMRIICSASHLSDLIVGRLYSEGLVRTVDEIALIDIDVPAMEAHVELPGRQPDLGNTAPADIPTCATSDKLVNNYFVAGEPMRPLKPRQWDPVLVFDAAHEFRRDKTAHARTRGAHSAYLFGPDGLLCLREDIGRHNAFDKAIGWALTAGVDLYDCMLYTSGRVPTDMLTKAIRAGLPMLVSKSVPTEKAVQMAREYGVIFITNALPRSFDIMNGAEWMIERDAESLQREIRTMEAEDAS